MSNNNNQQGALPHPSTMSASDLVMIITNATTAPFAQSISLLNLIKSGRSVTTFSNAAYTVLATDMIVAQIGTMSASRVVTLPAANAVPAGSEIIVADFSGSVTSTNTIVITRAGSDTINATTTETIQAAYGARKLISDGTSKWVFDAGVLRSANNLSDITSAATARTNLGLQIPDIQVFTTTGAFTWTKPTGTYNWCEGVLIGGGGGAGSGARTATSAASVGGAGGGGSGYGVFKAPFSTMPSTVAGSVGAGGAGGAAVTVDTTAGSPGVAGGTTNFGTFIRVTGGNLGAGGSTGGAAGGGASSVANFIGAGGAAGNVAGAVGAAGNNNLTGGAAGGGSGGGIDTGNTVYNGGAGGSNSLANISGGAGGTAGGNGTAGTSATANMPLPGPGGGGGAAALAAISGSGGAGGKYGAGGGGGAASRNGFNSGAGGAGADGICIIFCT